ncbi:MAG: sigma-70 family RNA polymerase sigma factor [Planctomycetes bacterium]|nr:sigma-70 family RNA polymerase sigma factor [Planctomycetota bacterium]
MPDSIPITDLLIHADFVRNLAHALARDPEVGDDLLQEVWVAALQRPPQHGASLRGWLAALVSSLFRNRLREERRRRAREAQLPPLPPCDPADEIVAREQVRQRLLAAVLRLEEPFRTAVLLRYHEELTPKQIAERLAVPAATVRTRIARGLERLRRELDHEHGEHRGAWLLPLFSLPGSSLSVAGFWVLAIAMKKSTLAIAALLLVLTSMAIFLVSFSGSSEDAGNAAPQAASQPGDAGLSASTLLESGSVQRSTAEAHAAAATEVAVEPQIEASAGELLVRVVWADLTPAIGVHVFVSEDGEVRESPLIEQQTDAHGQILATVPFGKVTVRCDRDGEASAEVRRGTRCEVQLKIQEGLEVVGVVRDTAGEPVADAAIWLTSHRQPWSAMACVTRSDAEGRFRVRSAPKRQSFGATAAGYEPSPLVDLETRDLRSVPVEIELALTPGGNALFGRVTDSDGRPVARASIAVGSPSNLYDHSLGNTTTERWAPARTRSDAEGNYRLPGLAVAEHPVEVWAAGHPFWHGTAVVTAGAPTRLDIMLPKGVTVFGVVTGEDGAPLPRAMVRAYPRALPENFLMSGQHDYESVFGARAAVADEQGRYRLLHAAPGELHLYANAHHERSLSSVVPWAQELQRVEAGVELEWNPRVLAGATIHGVARTRDGVPLEMHFVSAQLRGQKRRHSVVTDENGRFRFVCLERQPYDISLQLWSPPEGSAPVEARGVWPDAGELELVTTYDSPRKESNGSVRGAVVDAAGRAKGTSALSVLLVSNGNSWNTESVIDGKFAFTDVAPGPKHLVLVAGDDPIHFGEPFELAPGEARDIGTLTTAEGGSLLVRFVRGPETEAMTPTLYVTTKGASHGRRIAVGHATELLLENLCVGPTTLSGWCEGMEHIRAETLVSIGTTTTVTVTLRAAVWREMLVEYAEALKLTRVLLAEENGRVVWDEDSTRSRERPYRFSAPLSIGTYTLTAELEDRRAETTFTVPNLEPSQPPIVLRVK